MVTELSTVQLEDRLTSLTLLQFSFPYHQQRVVVRVFVWKSSYSLVLVLVQSE